MYYGYCYALIDGEKVQMPKVSLNGVQGIFNYVMLQKGLFEEVIITDEDDYCVVHAKKGEVVFPNEWNELENKYKKV